MEKPIRKINIEIAITVQKKAVAEMKALVECLKIVDVSIPGSKEYLEAIAKRIDELGKVCENVQRTITKIKTPHRS